MDLVCSSCTHDASRPRADTALVISDFPDKTLIRFMHNHHLLQITGKPKWLVVKGGRSVKTHLSSSFLPWPA